jgi:hypothetical protein
VPEVLATLRLESLWSNFCLRHLLTSRTSLAIAKILSEATAYASFPADVSLSAERFIMSLPNWTRRAWSDTTSSRAMPSVMGQGYAWLPGTAAYPWG